MATKHLVRNWTGSRDSYNAKKRYGFLDPWTKYFVVENDGTIVEYFGENKINNTGGQFLSVKDILETPPAQNKINPYDRFLVGNNENGYKLYEYTTKADGSDFELTITPFDWRYGVRVYSKGLKNFVYFDGTLETYDDVDGGEF
jgi:hypothetical protein